MADRCMFCDSRLSDTDHPRLILLNQGETWVEFGDCCKDKPVLRREGETRLFTPQELWDICQKAEERNSAPPGT